MHHYRISSSRLECKLILDLIKHQETSAVPEVESRDLIDFLLYLLLLVTLANSEPRRYIVLVPVVECDFDGGQASDVGHGTHLHGSDQTPFEGLICRFFERLPGDGPLEVDVLIVVFVLVVCQHWHEAGRLSKLPH